MGLASPSSFLIVATHTCYYQKTSKDLLHELLPNSSKRLTPWVLEQGCVQIWKQQLQTRCWLKGPHWSHTKRKSLQLLIWRQIDPPNFFEIHPKVLNYWLNYWHILISKATRGLTSNTLLMRIHYLRKTDQIYIGADSIVKSRKRGVVGVGNPVKV